MQMPDRYCVMLLILLLSLQGCDKDQGNRTPSSADRRNMLENYATHLIIPAYQSLKAQADRLKTMTDTFATNPDLQSLDTLQHAFVEAYQAWQAAEVFELGPARDMLLRSSLNTFPTDTTLIGNNIRNGSYNLDAAPNFKAKGFPALDYLLFGLGADNLLILSFYTTDAYASGRLNYLKDVAGEIKTKTDAVLNAWLQGYAETFKNADGTDAGSSIALLVNELNYTWELTKNARIGIPLGKKSLNVPLPEKTEAYYSGLSLDLAVLNMMQIQRVFTGESASGIAQGPGLKAYLDKLEAKHSGKLLSDTILAQINHAIASTLLIPNPLSEAVVQNPQAVDDAYREIQKTVVLLKTDMPSVMGILITYQDSDGD
ncbi:MAG: iron-regulated protein A precursor [Chitinophagales bacterium]|nr:MAG: iron-regulated protein A precursor [Chitinophagales bacterium]